MKLPAAASCAVVALATEAAGGGVTCSVRWLTDYAGRVCGKAKRNCGVAGIASSVAKASVFVKASPDEMADKLLRRVAVVGV